MPVKLYHIYNMFKIFLFFFIPVFTYLFFHIIFIFIIKHQSYLFYLIHVNYILILYQVPTMFNIKYQQYILKESIIYHDLRDNHDILPI